jgi:hypothetical protein
MVYLKELDKGENQTQISKRNAKGIEQKWMKSEIEKL